MRPEMVGSANPAASHGGAAAAALSTFMEEDGEPTSSASLSSTFDASADSSSTSDLTDDAASTPARSPPPPPCPQRQTEARGPLYELPSLMAQLPPVRRGLSRFFPGKSQSFACLSNARRIEDLAKPEVPYGRKMMKPCRRSYGGVVEFGSSKPYFAAPGPYGGKPMSKKSPKGSCASLAARLGGAAVVPSAASRPRCP